jgi:hypothetical protein
MLTSLHTAASKERRSGDWELGSSISDDDETGKWLIRLTWLSAGSAEITDIRISLLYELGKSDWNFFMIND